MPHIDISLYKGRSQKEKEEICRKLHEAAIELLNFPSEAVSISLTEYEPEEFQSAINNNLKEGELIISSKVIK